MTIPRVWKAAARPTYAGPLLLDTHLWVWMLDPTVRPLPTAIVPLIGRAAASNALCVSDLSFWEVGNKVAKGALRLTVPVGTWVSRAAAAPGIQYLTLERDILVLSTQLTTMHGDPADRILVATAKLSGIPLATIDRRIIGWAAEEGMTPLCDAS